MKERNAKQTENTKKIRLKRVSAEKRFYLWTALACAMAMVAIVVVAVAVSGNEPVEQAGTNNSTTSAPDSTLEGEGDKDVVVTPEGMIMPLETVSVVNDYGFYHNKTLNIYHEHTGMDFSAEAGTQVLAVEAGTIESIYKGDLLSGTEIVIDHGNGLKSLYRFVTETETLSVGDTVEKGEVIATVAEANGDEYKDGAHLHFEIKKDEKTVDPNEYLTLEEK